MFASKARDSADPRVIVGDGSFAANWDGKSWSRGMGVKSVDEMNDDFVALSDSEASKLVSAARSALANEFADDPLASQLAANVTPKVDPTLREFSDNTKWAATFVVWAAGAGLIGWLWGTRVFVSDFVEQLFGMVLYFVAFFYVFTLRPIHDWLGGHVFHSSVNTAVEAAKAVKAAKLAAQVQLMAGAKEALASQVTVAQPLKPERNLEFGDWDDEPIVFWDTGKEASAWVFRSGAWEEVDGEEYADAYKDTRLMSESAFEGIFGKLPPLPL